MTAAFYFIAFLGFPIGMSFVIAFAIGRFFRTRAKAIPSVFKVLIAWIVSAGFPIAYYWVWQAIEIAHREAVGDTSAYMGPIVILVYGFPIFLISTTVCLFIAGHAYGWNR